MVSALMGYTSNDWLMDEFDDKHTKHNKKLLLNIVQSCRVLFFGSADNDISFIIGIIFRIFKQT